MAVVDLIPTPPTPRTRPSTTVIAPQEDTSFLIKPADRTYKHQYSNIYFVRLHALRQHVEQRAKRRWARISGSPVFVPRVLEVEKGKLSFIVGTVYMDMPLKPNVLEDIARDRSLPAPPPKEKFHSYNDSVMLEDESGRICLVGERILSASLVTGVILGALGIETHNGDFEVVDLCFPGMAPQPSAGLSWPTPKHAEESMDVDGDSSTTSDEWVALVSGLETGAANAADGQFQMLAEYLVGEAGGLDDQSHAARISRLIVAGNSLAPIATVADTTIIGETDKKSRKHGHEASFTPHPTHNLAAHLTDICRSIPVHLLPGPSDPAATILPQQPLPRAMFGGAASYATFFSESNPTYICVTPARGTVASRASQPGASTSKAKSNGSIPAPDKSEPTRTIMVHSGQPVDDMFKYVPTPPISRMKLAESTLLWRHIAPTAPDTLWCHPYFTKDPFVMSQTPDIYVIGNQPSFSTKLVEDGGDPTAEDDSERAPKRCRIVLLPKFRESGMLVLVNLRTLGVRRVQFTVEGMNSGGGET